MLAAERYCVHVFEIHSLLFGGSSDNCINLLHDVKLSSRRFEAKIVKKKTAAAWNRTQDNWLVQPVLCN